jgi:hypothetical protein
MSAKVSFTLVVFASERRNGQGQYLTANVQVWNDQKHLCDVQLLQGHEYEWPEHGDRDTAEGYAVNAARVLARALSEVHMSAVEKEIMNQRSELQEQADHAS